MKIRKENKSFTWNITSERKPALTGELKGGVSMDAAVDGFC